MAGQGGTPGNGNTNPFGNGSGGTAGKAAPWQQAQNPQKPVSNIEIDTASMPAGGPLLLADPNRAAASAKDIGTTAGGNRPPFKLKG